MRHLCDELNERLTQTCELELRSLCLYLCFSKSAAAWLRTGPGTSWATPRSLTSPVLTSSRAPSCTLQRWTTRQQQLIRDPGRKLVLKKILSVEVIDPSSSSDWAGRDSCLLQTKKSVSRLDWAAAACVASVAVSPGYLWLSALIIRVGTISPAPEPVLMISKSKARSDNARECCGYHRDCNQRDLET